MGASPPVPHLAGRLHQARAAISAVVRGKEHVVERALVAVLAGGHLLVEDVPGVGKTTLAKALASSLGGTFKRIQCTSDLLPADMVGVNILTADKGFTFRPGPVFANVVLADELNRATPRTQSALLEAMTERNVTVDGATHRLPSPFTVVATQNPFELHGTHPLPESQLDRFLIRTDLGYPDREVERTILRDDGRAAEDMAAVTTPEELLSLGEVARTVRVHQDVEDYILDIVARSRRAPALTRGISPRGAGAMCRAIRALALIRGRTWAMPEDVRELAVPVWAHRVLLRDHAPRGPGAAEEAMEELLWSVAAPGS